jgi:polysaccharide biosynthesis protein PslE
MPTSMKREAKRAQAWADAPRLGFVDLIAMVWNERATVIIVGMLVCAFGAVFVLLAPKHYTARAELLVRLGQEYVYQPSGGGGGASADIQGVVNAEMRMLGSGAVVRRVIETVGLATLYPNIAAAPGPEADKIAAAERAFAEHLTLETAPQTPAIALSFEHNNPQIAARTLNTLIDTYLARRREVLVGGEYDALSRQSAVVDERVNAASTALAAFLSQNQIGDFETELAALAQRVTDTDTQLLDAAARRGEAEARRAALSARYQAEPAQIELYSESDARRQLVEAQLEREQLLSRYQGDALPVREVDRRISQLELFLAGGDPPSLTRRGPNPVQQDLAGQLFAMEAEARAQRGREVALREQREQFRARLRQLQELEPEFRRLLRERTILEQSAGNFATRAEDARAFNQMLSGASETISQVERAQAPTQGKSLRLPIAVVTVLIAGLAGVAAGLVRGYLRQGFPTPSSAARTLGAPVLAVMRRTKTKPDAKASKTKPALRLVKGAT